MNLKPRMPRIGANGLLSSFIWSISCQSAPQTSPSLTALPTLGNKFKTPAIDPWTDTQEPGTRFYLSVFL
jgi:hypothetical protein